MIFTRLIFLHVCILTADSKAISPLSEVIKKNIPLNMAPKSVDDVYYLCNVKMNERVNDYLKEELSKPKFSDIWTGTKSNTWATEKMKGGDKGLTLNHFKALFVYTSKKTDNNGFFKDFMEEVRTKGPVYPSGFSYRALHFFLSDAIHILKKKQPGCVTTYRRTRDTFKVKVGDVIRFGSFASSSPETSMSKYGAQDCFEIKTCYGANLKSNEVYDQDEVLIPPYEKFKITAVKPAKQNVLKCNNMWILESWGIDSTLNCKFTGAKQ